MCLHWLQASALLVAFRLLLLLVLTKLSLGLQLSSLELERGPESLATGPGEAQSALEPCLWVGMRPVEPEVSILATAWSAMWRTA